jgi:hypothetical protein
MPRVRRRHRPRPPRAGRCGKARRHGDARVPILRSRVGHSTRPTGSGHAARQTQPWLVTLKAGCSSSGHSSCSDCWDTCSTSSGYRSTRSPLKKSSVSDASRQHPALSHRRQIRRAATMPVTADRQRPRCGSCTRSRTSIASATVLHIRNKPWRFKFNDGVSAERLFKDWKAGTLPRPVPAP